MRVLGIDPGMADTGWAVLDDSKLTSSGLVKTEPPQALPERLHRLHAEIVELLARFSPDAVAIEEMFFVQIAHTVRATLQARGVILLAAAQAKVPVFEYNPRQVKSALTGSGTAAKAQMQKMVQRTLALTDELRPDDVSDAAAIALCHFRLSRFKNVRVLEKVGGRGDDVTPAKARIQTAPGRPGPGLRRSDGGNQ